MDSLVSNIKSWGSLFWNTLVLVEPKDVVDIVLVSLAIYFILIFIKQTRSYLVFYFALALLATSYLSSVLDLGLTRQILQTLATFIVLVFIIVFQRDIRRFFTWVVSSSRQMGQNSVIISSEVTSELVKTVEEMARKKIGAIVVIPGEYPIEEVIEGGFALDGRVSRPLLLSIFDTSTPGHDGAVVIDHNRVRRFGVHLPLAENYQGFDKAGTRHRAAAGVTERTDALAIVVSEERGQVSIAEGGKLQVVSDMKALENRVRDFVKENTPPDRGKFWNYFVTKNFTSKIVSVALAIFLWFIFVSQIGVVAKDFTLPLELRFLDKGRVVDYISVKEIKVTLTGSDRDLRNLSEGQIKAVMDLDNLKNGWHSVELDESNISYPSYLSLVKISPQVVSFSIKDSSGSQSGGGGIGPTLGP